LGEETGLLPSTGLKISADISHRRTEDTAIDVPNVSFFLSVRHRVKILQRTKSSVEISPCSQSEHTGEHIRCGGI